MRSSIFGDAQGLLFCSTLRQSLLFFRSNRIEYYKRKNKTKKKEMKNGEINLINCILIFFRILYLTQ